MVDTSGDVDPLKLIQTKPFSADQTLGSTWHSSADNSRMTDLESTGCCINAGPSSTTLAQH